MLKKMKLYPLSVLLIITLTACEGDGPDNNVPLKSFATLTDEQTALNASASGLAVTTLPDVGSATYSGVISAALGSGDGLAGSLSLEANFETNGITGQVTNIVDSTEGHYDGFLTIEGDVITTGAAQIDASLTGTLQNSDNRLTGVTATMSGNFLGTEQEMISGTVTGTVVSPDVPGGTTDLTGTFVGEQ